jgi:hypothetical protein
MKFIVIPRFVEQLVVTVAVETFPLDHRVGQVV